MTDPHDAAVPQRLDLSEIEEAARERQARWDADMEDRRLRYRDSRPPAPSRAPLPDPDEEPLSDAVVHHARLFDMKLPARYRDAVPCRAETWTWLLTAGDGAGLLLTGPTGTGKTYEAFGAVRAWAAAGYTARHIMFGNVAHLLDRARPDGDLTVQKIAEAGLLILDDLGAIKATEWTGEALYRIVDWRWNEMLPTVATSNLAPPALAAAIGDRVADRIRGSYLVAAFTGGSRRG